VHREQSTGSPLVPARRDAVSPFQTTLPKPMCRRCGSRIAAPRCRCTSSLRSRAGSLSEGVRKWHRGLVSFGFSCCLADLMKATLSCQRPWFTFGSAPPAIPLLLWHFGRSLPVSPSCFSLAGGCWAPPRWHRRDTGSGAQCHKRWRAGPRRGRGAGSKGWSAGLG